MGGDRSIANNTSRLTVITPQGLSILPTHEQMNGHQRVVSTVGSIIIDRQIADMTIELDVTIVSNLVTKIECAQCKTTRTTAKMIAPIYLKGYV